MSSTLLLADDSLTIQKVVELTFADTDFKVVAVSSGEELLRQIPLCQPDAIICDVIMPGKDGYQVCQEVKSNPSSLHIPVVLLTGTFEPFDRDRALAAGCSEVITKPFEARKLVETVERLVQSTAAPVPDHPPTAERGAGAPWSDADRPSSGGFQPLETPELEDDFDFGTRLSMPSQGADAPPPVEPVQPPAELEEAWAPEEGGPEEPPAEVPEEPELEEELAAEAFEADAVAVSPVDEPQLGPEDFEQVDLTGEVHAIPEGFETTEMSAEDLEQATSEAEEAEAETAEPEPPALVAEGSAEVEESPVEDRPEPDQEPIATEAPAPAVPSTPAPVPPVAVVSPDAGSDEPFGADDSGIGARREKAATTAREPQISLTEEDVERIARRVLELASDTLERIAWEVLPDMAELVVRERVRQLEAAVDEAAPAEDLQ